MERRRGYKGFVIEAFPHELKDGSGFTTDFFIEDHDASGVNVTQFVLKNVFRTEDEAIIAAHEAGKQKIDSGWHPESVPA
jgi:hypothetical protein